nr:DUF4188 domain-containing protein [Halomarina sp. BCD28]
MRLNRLRAVREWVAAGRKLAAMFERLEADPDSGFLGYQPAFMGLRTGAAIQYWRSLADLKRFANDPDGLHVPAWTWYEDEGDEGGGVGFWTELYVVEAGSYETFFRNISDVGLGVPWASSPAPTGSGVSACPRTARPTRSMAGQVVGGTGSEGSLLPTERHVGGGDDGRQHRERTEDHRGGAVDGERREREDDGDPAEGEDGKPLRPAERLQRVGFLAGRGVRQRLVDLHAGLFAFLRTHVDGDSFGRPAVGRRHLQRPGGARAVRDGDVDDLDVVSRDVVVTPLEGGHRREVVVEVEVDVGGLAVVLQTHVEALAGLERSGDGQRVQSVLVQVDDEASGHGQ